MSLLQLLLQTFYCDVHFKKPMTRDVLQQLILARPLACMECEKQQLS